MIKRSTKECSITPLSLNLNRAYYYVKRRSIVERVSFNNRTFYAKFERVDEPLSDMVISQHLSHQYIIAAPLLENNQTNYLIIEYRGVETLRFYHMSRHLLKLLEISDYHYYEGKRKNYLQLFIPVDRLSLEDADEMVHKISDDLGERLIKDWKCFPDKSLPESYNIITLPYRDYKI
ncbi:MAG: DUF1882 domain-containing protein [Campylobacterota bacterium]|nr:DUF1882 domain-containing protein [Campylobacterota bacterium]